MSNTTFTAPVPFGAITIYRLVAKFDDLRAAVAEWRETRATRAQLYSLSDDVLRDIGISRWEIDRTIR